MDTPTISKLPIAATRNRQPDREENVHTRVWRGQNATDQVATLVSFKALVQQ